MENIMSYIHKLKLSFNFKNLKLFYFNWFLSIVTLYFFLTVYSSQNLYWCRTNHIAIVCNICICLTEPVSVMGQMILSFSALSNARKILNCDTAPKDSLTCVHGLRFFSLAWVIMVHTYLQVFAIAGQKSTLSLKPVQNFVPKI